MQSALILFEGVNFQPKRTGIWFIGLVGPGFLGVGQRDIYTLDWVWQDGSPDIV